MDSRVPGRLSVAEINKQYRAIHADLEGESDRAAAVLGAAYLDELLKRLLSEATAAPLARTFGARIEAAYAMGLIPTIVRDDLNVLRDLRNRFAHESQFRSLSDASAKELLAKLHLMKAIADEDLNGYDDIDRRLHRQAISSLRLELAFQIREVTRPTPPSAVSPVYLLVQQGRKAAPTFGVDRPPY